MILVVDVGNTNIVLGVYQGRSCCMIFGSVHRVSLPWTNMVY